jgi:aminoglycoside phosphotransferase (APT) family kinase protein
MVEWAPEIVVDTALARRLIAEQFPELATAESRLLSQGWDSTVFVVGGEWIFRFPRREMVVPGFEIELALLPRLAPLLPVAIPVATHVGEPTEHFHWPFAGSRLIPGREPPDAALDDAARLRLARPLGTALRALHGAAPRAAAGNLRIDAVRRGDMSERVPLTRQRLADLDELCVWSAPPAVEETLEEAEALPPAEATAVCHGDLHFRHVLVGDDGGVTGIIDWIDVCLGDPGIDLLLLWSLFPPEGREPFLDAYGPIAPASLLRARVLAFFLCATLALYGRHEGLAAIEREAVGGLARASVPL